ncbi:MAG TPA: hypothetical protein PLK37_03610 [Terricaulis sp.]|nr:hypothetical protein [Terricaulis sp.]
MTDSCGKSRTAMSLGASAAPWGISRAATSTCSPATGWTAAVVGVA